MGAKRSKKCDKFDGEGADGMCDMRKERLGGFGQRRCISDAVAVTHYIACVCHTLSNTGTDDLQNLLLGVKLSTKQLSREGQGTFHFLFF